MRSFDERSLMNACRTIFGPDVDLGHDFLYYIQPEGVKSAFRRKAMETHPDRCNGDERVKKQKSLSFQNLINANKVLTDFIQKRHVTPVNQRTQTGFQYKSSCSPNAKANTRPANNPGNSKFSGGRYSGRMPEQKLPFGRFLYYKGAIEQKDLITALTQQSSQRPRIGHLAQKWGWLSDEEMKKILTYKGPFARFGEKALRMGILTREQVQSLLWFQRSSQQKIGDFFVEQGVISEEELKSFLKDFEKHNRTVQK